MLDSVYLHHIISLAVSLKKHLLGLKFITTGHKETTSKVKYCYSICDSIFKLKYITLKMKLLLNSNILRQEVISEDANNLVAPDCLQALEVPAKSGEGVTKMCCIILALLL